MKLATTPQEQRRWMEQWRQAAIALDEVKRYDLAHLTEEEAWIQTEDLISVPEGWRNPTRDCGLIEQQSWFWRNR